MFRRYVVFSAIVALVGLVTWVEGQDRPAEDAPVQGSQGSPTLAEGEPPAPSRYQSVTQDVANEYGGSASSSDEPTSSGRVQPDPKLPSVLKRPGATTSAEAPPRQLKEPSRFGDANDGGRPRPVPTAVAPKGAPPKRATIGRTASPRTNTSGRTTNPHADGHPSRATPAQPYGQQVAPPEPELDENPQQLVIQSPQLQLKAIGPDAITVGKPAKYQVQLANLGNNDADSIVVRVVLPATVEIARLEPSAGVAEKMPNEPGTLAWTLEEIKARQSVVLTLTLVTDVAETFPINVDWAVRPQSLVANIAVQKPELKIAIDGPDDVLFGASQIFVIRVQNPGTGPAKDVRLSLATGDSEPRVKEIGTIAAGKEEIIRVELIAREAGSLEVIAAASSDDLNTNARKKVLVRRAELNVQVAGPPVKYANTDGTYRLVVTNTGNAVAEDVAARLQLPVGCRLLAASDDGRDKSGSVEWVLPKLEPGQKAEFSVRCLFEAAGDQRVTAAVESGVLLANDKFSTRVEAIADLKMVVHDPRGPRPIGEDVSYVIEITNRGSKSAANVKVSGFFSEGIDAIKIDGHQAQSGNGAISFAPIPRIDPGKTVKLTIIARATQPGNLVFKAVVECDSPETKLAAEDTTRYFGSDLGGPARVGADNGNPSR